MTQSAGKKKNVAVLSFVDVNVWEQLSQKAEAYVSPCAETGVCNPIDTAEPRPPTD